MKRVSLRSMIVLLPFLILALLVAAAYLRTKPRVPTTAKEAFQAYQSLYDTAVYDKSKRYNRAAFRLVHGVPMFLDDNPFTSAYIQPAERETLKDNDEVFCMVVAVSNLFGYTSHTYKQAQRATLLVFRAAPFREVGRIGTGFTTSWRVDDVNYHVLDDHFMEYRQVKSFESQAKEGYTFNKKY